MDVATVAAARAGDSRALDALIAGYLPLVYNIVGRALHGHADVDDVVQETMLRVVDGLSGLRDPGSFRSWVVAIAMHQVRDRHRRLAPNPDNWSPDDIADPGADFADLAIVRLHLSGQRQEVAQATRWLDTDDRELLSLWWLESAGELSRDEVATALHLSRQHTAVRVQRMKAQLDAARAVVRALNANPRCPELAAMIDGWDHRPSPLWRKRLARHTRECRRCDRSWSELIAAERLLAGMPLVPIPLGWSLHGAIAAHIAVGSTGTTSHALAGAHIAKAAGWLTLKPLVAGAVSVAVVAGVSVTAYALSVNDPAPRPAAAIAPAPSTHRPSFVPSAVPTTQSPSPVKSSAPVVVPPASPRPPAVQTPKKGASTWSSFGGSSAALKDVKASWFYNWGPDSGGVSAPGVEFVPMIWGTGSVTSANLTKVKGAKDLLGFNEPDMGGQANMTPAQTLDLWPQLQATGDRLGSPSVAYGGDTPGGWLDQFMSGAKSRGYRVDFIALHWYGSDFSAAAAGQLKGYIQNVYNRYHLPIWLTEYALIKFSGSPEFPTQDQQAAFVKASTTMLEGLSYVERYAWFALPSAKTGDTGLYTNGTTPTGVGLAYREAGAK